MGWYAQDWWQWAFSAPLDANPVSDLDGRFCAIGQGGPVWYLAGGFGTSRINRSCTIPSGRYLFFPIINSVTTTPPGWSTSCAEVQATVARNYDDFVFLRAMLDGVPLPDLKQRRITPKECFDLAGRAEPELESHRYYPSATDGYWVMLAPLPAGDHALEFRGFITLPDSGEQMVQNIVYHLIVEE